MEVKALPAPPTQKKDPIPTGGMKGPDVFSVVMPSLPLDITTEST